MTDTPIDPKSFDLNCLDFPAEFFEFGMLRKWEMWLDPDVGATILHLAPGAKQITGAFSTDVIECEWPDYDFDDAHCLREWDDKSVGCIVATHLLEHLAEPRKLLAEAARVLIAGGTMNIVVPHADCQQYKQDLDHKTPFYLKTWTNLFDRSMYTKDKTMPFRVGFNMIMGTNDQNLAIITQLVKDESGISQNDPV